MTPPRMATSNPLDDQLVDLQALMERYEARRVAGNLTAVEVEDFDSEIDKARMKVEELQQAA